MRQSTVTALLSDPKEASLTLSSEEGALYIGVKVPHLKEHTFVAFTTREQCERIIADIRRLVSEAFPQD